MIFHCPACFRAQSLAANVLAPAPHSGVFVICPDCEVTAVHHPHPSTMAHWRRWALVAVETDVALFRRQLDRGVPA